MNTRIIPPIEENRLNNTTRMILVEDNFRARQALSVYLSQQAGIRVTAEASNGLEAVNLINSQPPEIVLMDMRMPVMDGLEATRIIKKNWPNIKVIILTIYPNYQTEARSAGADAFLVKGCSVNEIISTIHKVL
jgi:DNA-binding NarL/FixJ family response regulator